MRHNALSLDAYALGKGEVDSSILSGSTSGNADQSRTFSDFRRERTAIEKSREVQNDPAPSAINDTLVTRRNTFRSAAPRLNLTAPLRLRRPRRPHRELPWACGGSGG